MGTSLAVSQAIHLAARLRRQPWTTRHAVSWSAQANASFERAKSAFQFWYDGQVQCDATVAREVQEDYLIGRSFRSDVVGAYATMVDEGNRQAAAVLRVDVDALLPDSLRDSLLQVETNPAETSVQLTFPGGVVDVHAVEPGSRAWRRVETAHGCLGISYPGATLPAEAEELARVVAARAQAWHDVLAAVASMYS